MAKYRAEREWNLLHFVNRGYPDVICPNFLDSLSKEAIEDRQRDHWTPKVVTLTGFECGRKKCVKSARTLVFCEV